jgi:predicted enzyme related to lactoylglutathione lyase
MEIESCNVTIMVSDMDKAILFYTETLGMKLENRYGNHWADIEGPGISIGLHPNSASVTRGNNLQIGLRVDDIEKAIASLQKNGVQVNSKDEEQVRLASFTDPDGNVLFLVEPKW